MLRSVLSLSAIFAEMPVLEPQDDHMAREYIVVVIEALQ